MIVKSFKYSLSIAIVALLSVTSSTNANQLSAKQPTLTAQQITPENAAQLIQGGPDASGGIGDWFISNGTLCAIISDIQHEGEFSSKGGVLTDLSFCDRDDDQYTTAQDFLGRRDNVLHGRYIRLQQNNETASIIVQLGAEGVTQQTRYSLSLGDPTVLSISKRLTRTEDVNTFNIYLPMQLNANSLESFVFASKNLNKSNGFKNQNFTSRGIVGAIRFALRNADTIINHSPPWVEHGIAYGWQLVSAIRVQTEQENLYTIPTFVAVDSDINAMVIVPDTFYIGDENDIGLLQVPQIPLMSLAVGDSLEIEEQIYVSNHGDVASITDQIIPHAPLVSGRVNEPASALHIDFSDGTPFTFVRPQKDGRFSFHVPMGNYTIRHIGKAGRSQSHSIKVTNQKLDLGLLELPPAATLSLPQGHAMRLVFKGSNGTADPHFSDTLTGFSVTDKDGEHFKENVNQIFMAGVAGDEKSVLLAPGRYKVYATRGPEYSVEQTSIDIKSGENYDLSLAIPKQVVQTPNFIASDLHVHSGGSWDNTTSDALRVRSFVAEHGEVMVSSEHDKPVDFAPLIKAMGVATKITSIAAAEVTSLAQTERNRFTNGHFNFFPFRPQAHSYRRGMVNHEDKRIRDVIHAVRQLNQDVLVQLNHPRANLALSGKLPHNHEELIESAHYLDHMGSANHPYNPERALTEGQNAVLIEADPETDLRDIDFDLIEVINPSDDDHQERIEAVRKDWLSFLKQGERITATANSDSHHSAQEVALPRTMVAMRSDKVDQFNQSEFLTALKVGNAYGTTGPMLDLNLNGTPMGGTLQADKAVLEIIINSADWIPVESLKVQINGETIVEQRVELGQKIKIPLIFNKDSFVTVETSGPASEIYSIIYPNITPYAFSNAIYVDYDKDGQWQAPGL